MNKKGDDRIVATVSYVAVKVPKLPEIGPDDKPLTPNDIRMQHFDASERRGIKVKEHYRIGDAIGRRPNGKVLILNRRFFDIGSERCGRMVMAKVIVNQDAFEGGTFNSLDIHVYNKDVTRKPEFRLIIEKGGEGEGIPILGSNGWFIRFRPLVKKEKKIRAAA